MKFHKIIKKLKSIILKNKFFLLVLALLFLIHLFLRIYQLEERAQFTWDQVDNAWNAKNIIVNHVFPLHGMPAKQSASVSIGPFYYYFVAFFYFLTNLDPIASPIIAVVVSIFSFFTLFIVTKKLFNNYVAFIALFINTFSFYLITMDRIQWPVDFIAPIGLLIYYSLLKIFKGELKFIFLISFLVGLSLHIHFTTIFYFEIIFLSLPMFPRSKKTIQYILYSLPLFAVWLIPFFISFLQKNQSLNMFIFLKQNGMRFHLRRVLQVSDVAFLEQTLIWGASFLNFFKYLTVPVFLLIYYLKYKKESFPLVYLTIIWFVIPWFTLSMFRGELTPYYFAITRYVVIGLISYIIYRAISYRKFFFLPVLVFFGLLFVATNLTQFVDYKTEGISSIKKSTYYDFKLSRGNEFTYGAGKTYLYYFYEYRAYGKK